MFHFINRNQAQSKMLVLLCCNRVTQDLDEAFELRANVCISVCILSLKVSQVRKDKDVASWAMKSRGVVSKQVEADCTERATCRKILEQNIQTGLKVRRHKHMNT